MVKSTKPIATDTEKPEKKSRIDAIFALPEARDNPGLARRLAYSSGLSVEEVKAKLSK